MEAEEAPLLHFMKKLLSILPLLSCMYLKEREKI